MNTLPRPRFQATPSLPLTLPPKNTQSRRINIGQVALNDDAIGQFNHALHEVSAQAPSVHADQVVSLARWLQALPADIAVATINERIARIEQLRRLLSDTDWNVEPAFAQRARKLLDYLQHFNDLIPDDVPLVGHLDDALMVELSWEAFADEVQDFLDFCRFRSEQQPRGSAPERRAAWETACLAEANALLQRREIHARGYARTEPLNRPFRVY